MAGLIETILFTAALILFILFFIPGKYRKYFGIAAWTALVAGLFAMLPELIFNEGNVIYPVLIVLSVVLLVVTIKHLLKEDKPIMDFTCAGGVFCIIYVPFILFKPLADWLIGTVIYWISVVFNAMGFEYYRVAEGSAFYPDYWNFFFSVPPEDGLVPGVGYVGVGYADEIVLGCTGITAIALLVAVVFLTHTTWIKKILLLLLVTVPVYVINVFRNVFVITTYFNQSLNLFPEWFIGNPIPGFASYFWSHNVICEGAAFLVIIVLAVILFKCMPGLLGTVRDIVMIFVGDIRTFIRGKKQ